MEFINGSKEENAKFCRDEVNVDGNDGVVISRDLFARALAQLLKNGYGAIQHYIPYFVQPPRAREQLMLRNKHSRP